MTQQQTQHSLEAPAEPDLGKWRIRRNLHYWILGLVVITLSAFMLLDALKGEYADEATVAERKKQEERTRAAQAKTESAPPREEIEMAFARQQKEANDKLAAAKQVPESAQLPANLVPLPPVPQGASKDRLPPAGLPQPPQQSGLSQEELMASKREEQIASSNILAIDRSSSLAGRQQPSELERIRKEAVDLRRTDVKADPERMFDKALSATAGMAGGGKNAKKASPSGDREFLAEMAEEETSNDVIRPRAGRGRFALMQGATIPAVLITEIRSDLPGELKAQTTMDIYDSVSGSALLIPKGSLLVGRYNSEVRMGQEKVMAAFSRLIFPSGASVDLGAMKAAEGSGSTGVADEVDNHFWKMFWSNILIAGVAQLFEKSPNNVTVVNAGGGNSTTGLSSTTGQILTETVRVVNERNRGIPPTIWVYRGHKFNIMVNKDMVLPPYVTGVPQ